MTNNGHREEATVRELRHVDTTPSIIPTQAISIIVIALTCWPGAEGLRHPKA